MKINKKIALRLAIIILAVSSCEKMLDVESDQLVLPGEQKLNSPNAIIYPMIGILSQLEKLSERYVLLGELRGELMDITEYSRNDVVDIYNFNISADNEFNKIEDYYAVINNCNSLIYYTDTSVVYQAEKVLYREFSAAKAIRAWTYMQIALNYGEAVYYEDPLLSVEDATKDYPVYSINELAPLLIQDLEPYKAIEHPEAISLGTNVTSTFSYFQIRMLLGDLYLWSGQYEEAAREYRDLMFEETYLIYSAYQSAWTVENNVFIEAEYDWNDIFTFNSGSVEKITQFAGSTEYGAGSLLDSLCRNNYEIIPSAISKSNWENQTYYHSATALKPGDLRGSNASYYDEELLGSAAQIFTEGVIAKFMNMTSSTSKANLIYRSGLLYLRYAEAINRAGKPNAAWLILKSGMNTENLAPDSIVPAKEKYVDIAGKTFYDYMDFSDELFEFNIGVHERGCGRVHLATDFKIPSLSSLEDSIEYVEDKIVEELALETAFEGNRFHDLMRVALRRNNPAWLAKKVSEKYSDQAAMESKLMDPANWYIQDNP